MAKAVTGKSSVLELRNITRDFESMDWAVEPVFQLNHTAFDGIYRYISKEVNKSFP
jgi:hypothetical protein